MPARHRAMARTRPRSTRQVPRPDRPSEIARYRRGGAHVSRQQTRKNYQIRAQGIDSDHVQLITAINMLFCLAALIAVAFGTNVLTRRPVGTKPPSELVTVFRHQSECAVGRGCRSTAERRRDRAARSSSQGASSRQRATISGSFGDAGQSNGCGTCNGDRGVSTPTWRTFIPPRSAFRLEGSGARPFFCLPAFDEGGPRLAYV